MYQIAFEFLGEFIAFIIGLSVFRQLNTAFKIIAVQVIVAFCVELYSRYVRETTHEDSYWLYDYYLLIDCGTLLFAGYYLLKKQISILFFLVGFGLFLGVWAYDVYVCKDMGFNVFAEHAYILESIMIVALYLYILYHNGLSFKGDLWTMASLWLCIGIIIFYGCNIPNFSFYKFIVAHSSNGQRKISGYILDFLISIRYPFTALGFIYNSRPIYYQRNNVYQ